MKKAIFLALALALTFGAIQSSWAAPRTSANLNTNLIGDIDKAENQSVPIGTVIAWPYSTLPSDGDWLECNGQSVSQTKYPDFVLKFGNKTPNYQGMFLRGYGKQKYSQDNGGGKISSTTHQSGALGEIQGDGIRNIKGEITVLGTLDWGATSGVFSDGYMNYGGLIGGGNWWNYHTREFDASGVIPTANENRPINVAVRYIIKVK